MIISRTPFRISFFGGGTDYPQWYRENGGSVISATINKYSFITARHLPPFFDYRYRIRYYETEETSTVEEIRHPSARECLKLFDSENGLEIVHHADLPARSGLGSSSTFTVGLLNALAGLENQMVSKKELALRAIHVEQDLIGEAVGSQDQTAAAFGGFNRINFRGDHDITVTPILMAPERRQSLEDHLMLVFTGFARCAPDIAADQINQMGKKHKEHAQIQALAEDAFQLFTGEGDMVVEFGRLLHQQWMIKREITSRIANASIDEIYETGRRAGAIGGKLLGAGGGGFMAFVVKPEDQPNVRHELEKLLHVPFRFESSGSQIVYYANHS
jgi:D-glycero-alpha-D-manno-heptose-7-phosphate kinase